MNKAYDKVAWQNTPSTATPLNASNLNKMSDALDTIDDRVITLDGQASSASSAITALQEGKVDKVAGKGLSTNDYTDDDKTKLAGISAQANKVEITPVVTEGTTLATISIDGVDTAIKGSDIEVDSAMSSTSENPVQNKVIYETLQNILPEETAEGNPISITDASGLSAKSCEVTFSPKQSGTGDPSPSNIRPISGRDSLVLGQSGSVNIADFKDGYGIDNSGNVVTQSGRCATTTAIPIFANTNYYIYTEVSASCIYSVFNGTTLVRRISGVLSGSMLDTSDGDKLYCCIYKGGSEVSVANNKPMVNIDTIATAYEPFVSLTTHTATFPSTIMGGSYDFVSGKLRIDKKFVSIDGNNEWVEYPENSGKFYCDAITPNEAKVVISGTEYISNLYPFSGTGETTSGSITIDKRFYGHNRYGRFWVYDSNYANDLAGFKTMLNTTPLQICYPLDTPTEITLTPADVNLLKGSNTVWTDGDTVQIKYSADIAAYIAEQLAQLS